MRSQPFVISRITGKAPAQLIVDPAADHLIQAQTGLVQRRLVLCKVVIVKQKADRKSLRKFRRAAKTAFLAVCRSQQLVADLLQRLRRERTPALTPGTAGTPGAASTRNPAIGANAKRTGVRNMVDQVISLLLDLRPPFFKRAAYPTQYIFP